jgi:hypothetical protein
MSVRGEKCLLMGNHETSFMLNIRKVMDVACGKVTRGGTLAQHGRSRVPNPEATVSFSTDIKLPAAQ